MLSTTNGACTVGDSTFVTVLLRQHPVLTGDKAILCSRDDYLQLTYSNLVVNPSAGYNDNGYGGEGWYHKDGSYAISTAVFNNETPTSITLVVGNFSPGDSLRSMVRSYHFGCLDTTNFIPLTIKGPLPVLNRIT
jgi:hypothetical protein